MLLNHSADGTLLKDQATVVVAVVVLLIRQGLRIEPTEALRDLSR